jgi:hypothetical protein
LKAESRKQPSQKAEIQIPKQKIESSPVKWQTEDFTGQGKLKSTNQKLKS